MGKGCPLGAKHGCLLDLHSQQEAMRIHYSAPAFIFFMTQNPTRQQMVSPQLAQMQCTVGIEYSKQSAAAERWEHPPHSQDEGPSFLQPEWEFYLQPGSIQLWAQEVPGVEGSSKYQLYVWKMVLVHNVRKGFQWI